MATVQNFEAQDEYTHFTACDACRRRKKKCDGRIAGCQHCAAKGLPCVYTPKRSKTTTAAPRRTTEILTHRTEDLDERLCRIEAAVYKNLKLGGLAQESLIRHRRNESSSASGDSDGDGDSENKSELLDARILPAPMAASGLQEEALSPTPRAAAVSPESSASSPRFEGRVGMVTLPISNVYIGASSPFSFISKSGMNWIDAKLGNTSFSALLERAQAACLSYSGPEGCSFGLGIPLTTALQRSSGFVETPELRAMYIHEYFTHVNSVTPLFSEHLFTNPTPAHLRNHRTWSASNTIVLALGAQHLAKTLPSRSIHYDAAFHYYNLTSRSLPEFLFSNIPSIPTVQALVGMALYLQEGDDSKPMFAVLGIAASIAAQLGLHRDPRRLRITDELTCEERVNAWWVLFCMDKELSLRSGQMSSIAERDVDVPLPPPSTRFGQRVELTWVMARVLRLLYAAAPAPPPVVEALQLELDQWLQRSDDVRLPLRQVLEGVAAEGGSWEAMACLVRVRWNYFCALMSVCRLPSSSDTDADVGIGSESDDDGLKLKQWARCEAAAMRDMLGSPDFGPARLPNRVGLLILTGATWVLFSGLVCKPTEGERDRDNGEREGDDDEGDVELLRSISRCVQEVEWAPEQCPQMRVLFSVLVSGMVELVDGFFSRGRG